MKKTKKNAKPVPVAVVYCGPTLKGIVKQFTVFTNGLPTAVDELIAKNPVVGNLVIPVDELAAFRAELKTPGSAASVIFTEASKIIKGGK